jgi:hypothetical protein
MDDTVKVAIPVDARAAPDLRDQRTREAIGRFVSRVLQLERGKNVESLFSAIERLSADAAAKGLTDEFCRRSWRSITPSAAADRLRYIFAGHSNHRGR